MKIRLLLLMALCLSGGLLHAESLPDAVKTDYDAYLADLWDHLHRNPELSLAETETAARMAQELRQLGFEVHERVGGTGVVALLKNGDGPLVMMRADMDGLPIEEASGLPNASVRQQQDPVSGTVSHTMHACGHDVHMTALIGTARQMMRRKDDWQGTLMLLLQPAEERGMGARMMREDQVWERFGTPDYALAFHVKTGYLAGTVNLVPAPWAGVDSVDLIVHGVGGHGAYPHQSKDPVVIGSQIVLALQTLVSREIAPTEAAVVTVGSFQAGVKHNIIPDRATLLLTVRNKNLEVREQLLAGIERIAVQTARAAGVPEDRLPEMIVRDERVPPTINDPALMARVQSAWSAAFAAERLTAIEESGMGGEDFPYFSNDPAIPSVYWIVGGTTSAELQAQANGGPPVPPHHSPTFKIDPESSVRAGVESTVVALLDLL